MSPKFYSFLWAIYFMAAAILWLAGVFTLVTGVVFGFVAFGFVFMGMMCVLPGTVAHPHQPKAKSSSNRVAKVSAETAPAMASYRSA